MPYIITIQPSEATSKLKEIYQSGDGRPSNLVGNDDLFQPPRKAAAPAKNS